MRVAGGLGGTSVGLNRRHALALAAGAALAGCEPTRTAQRIDGAWHRQALLQGHLSHWLRVALLPNGACRSAFTRDWRERPNARPSVELTHQARLVAALVAGHDAGLDPRCLPAAESAGRFLLKHLSDPVHGGFFHEVGLDGAMKADAKRGYGHAFALLALSELSRVSPDPAWPAAAFQTWQTLSQQLLDRFGGLVSDADRRFTHAQGDSRTQNPSMHLFEALLSMAQAPQPAMAQAGLEGARQMGQWVLSHLVQGQADGGAHVPEWYDAQWKPRTDSNGYIDLGHQFEWVHLLIDATRLGVSPTLGAVAERVLQFALAKGYDDIEGGCFNRVLPNETVDRGKGWWQQAECLHGLMVAAQATQRPELWRRVDQTLSWVQRTLIDAEHGGWRPGGDCLNRTCEDVQPDPHHMAQMHRAAWRLAG